MRHFQGRERKSQVAAWKKASLPLFLVDVEKKKKISSEAERPSSKKSISVAGRFQKAKGSQSGSVLSLSLSLSLFGLSSFFCVPSLVSRLSVSET